MENITKENIVERLKNALIKIDENINGNLQYTTAALNVEYNSAVANTCIDILNDMLSDDDEEIAEWLKLAEKTSLAIHRGLEFIEKLYK